MNYGYTEQLGSPLRGGALEELRGFLAQSGLHYAPGVRHTVLIRDTSDRIAATGSLEGDVIKCVAVSPSRRGEGLTAAVLTALRRVALEEGRRRLFLYTKPANLAQFEGLGFYEVARGEEAMLMEDRRGGFEAWAESVGSAAARGTIGAAVMNCNPMTVGHQYLIEQAAGRCDFLYLLIVSEDRSAVPAADRLAIVEESAGHLPNIKIAGTGPYLISSATFPDYFLKDQSRAGAAWTDLDLAVFRRLARRLGITRRFVGSEPFCPVTGAYNRAMAEKLPDWGIELVELPRLEREGRAVSATAVRELVKAGRWREIRPLVPEASWAYFSREENRAEFLERL